MILVKPDVQIQGALKRLSSSQDFNTILKWLTESLSQCDLNNRIYETPTQLYRGQGYSQILQAILDAVQEAKKQ